MKKRIILVLSVLFLVNDFAGLVSAQTKRRQQPKRTRASRQSSQLKITLGQLSEEQLQALSNALEQTKALEVTYRYDSRRYDDEATRVAKVCWDASKLFPNGEVKTAISEMGDAHYNAGRLYAKLFPTPKVETHEERAMRKLIESSEALDRERGRGNTAAEERRRAEEEDAREEAAHLAKTLERYGVQHLPPYQAQAAIFDIAVGFRKLLSDALQRQPALPQGRKSLQPSPSTSQADKDKARQCDEACNVKAHRMLDACTAGDRECFGRAMAESESCHIRCLQGNN